MLSSTDLSFHQTLPVPVFNQLRKSLQQMAQSVGNQALVLTEAILLPLASSQHSQSQFTLLLSPQFNVLLEGSPQQGGEAADQTTVVDVKLTFEVKAIASFITHLKSLFSHDSVTKQRLESYRNTLTPNDANRQSQYTLLLLQVLLPSVTSAQTPYPHVSVCQPVEEALKKQIAQERLLNQITTQIRQSQELTVILATAVERVREFLDLDRIVIYKFPEPTLLTTEVPTSPSPSSYLPPSPGAIIYESRARDTITSVLNSQDSCFAPSLETWEKYRQGIILAIADVEATYALQDGFLAFFQTHQVRAQLAAPIVFQSQLWGLLIAHQCDTTRQWQETETSLFKQIGEQLAIAIHQADLMNSLNQEKMTLEERLIDCTVALEDALVAAQAASRIRSEFLATINHELFTPLTHVIGMSSTLLRLPLGQLSQQQRDYLQKIHDSGEHLLELINDIIDLSQLEAGKAVLNLREFSIINLAQNSIDSLSAQATAQQVHLRLDLQIPQQRDKLTADRDRITKIIWHLLTNAVKFTPSGGDVTLRLWFEEDTFVLQVEDTGIGIAAEKLPLLFEKFQQLDSPLRRRYQGTGLGLALTKQLVELHRGRIEVESSLDIGSIFTVWIPNQTMNNKQ